MATNRYSAEQGRSAAAAINVVTRAGTDTLAGTATFLLRDDALRACPRPTTAARQGAALQPRSSISATLGGPIARGKAWWFAAAEYRNQDAVVQTGTRDVAARTIRQTLAAAPLDDFLGLARVDWRSRTPTASASATWCRTRRTSAPARSTGRSAPRRSASRARTATTRASSPGRA